MMKNVPSKGWLTQCPLMCRCPLTSRGGLDPQTNIEGGLKSEVVRRETGKE